MSYKDNNNNNKHWCKYCKIFVQDNISVKNHEEGWRHKNNVTRFVSTQNREKKYQERDQKEAEREINRIKNQGTKSFREKDLGRVLEEKKQQHQQNNTQPHYNKNNNNNSYSYSNSKNYSNNNNNNNNIQQPPQQQIDKDCLSFKEIQEQQKQQINKNDYYNYYQDRQQLIYDYYQQEQNAISLEQPINTSLYGYTESPPFKSIDNLDSPTDATTSTASPKKRKYDKESSPIPSKILKDSSNKEEESDEEEKEKENSDNGNSESEGNNNSDEDDDSNEESSSSSEVDQTESIVGQWETVSPYESAFGSTRKDSEDEKDRNTTDENNNKIKEDDKDYSDVSDVDSEEEVVNINRIALSKQKSSISKPILISPTIPSTSKSFESKLSFNKSGVFSLNDSNNNNNHTIPPEQPQPAITLKFNKPLKQRNIRKTNIENKQT